MSTYEKPIWMLLLDFVESKNLQADDVFTRDDVLAWFETNYPKLKKNSIQCHLIKLSTNLPSRVHYKADPLGSDDIFFRITPSTFRLYDPTRDPAPIYNFSIAQPNGNSAKSLILTSGRRRGGRISERWKAVRAFEKVALRPILPVRDAQAESTFYRKLGFLVHPETETTQVVQFNGDILFILQEVAADNLGPIQHLMQWQFYVPHLKRFSIYLQDALIEIEEPYTRQSWGEYTLRLRSPNGYAITFREE